MKIVIRMEPLAAEPRWYFMSLHNAMPTGESVGLRKYQNATAPASANCWQAINTCNNYCRITNEFNWPQLTPIKVMEMITQKPIQMFVIYSMTNYYWFSVSITVTHQIWTPLSRSSRWNTPRAYVGVNVHQDIRYV